MTNNLSNERSTKSESSVHKEKPFKLYYGANKWGEAEWRGRIYHVDVNENEFLNEYVKHFNGVALNATYYRMFNEMEIKKLVDKVEGNNFLFCPKFPGRISHSTSFLNLQDETDKFVNSVLGFGKHLGPLFLQLSNKYSPRKKRNLYLYLQSLPKDLQLFLEVKHPDWFEEAEYEKHLAFLKKNNIGTIIHAGSELTPRLDLTIPKCFIRFTPDGSNEQVLFWLNKLKEWAMEGLREAYFFVEQVHIKEHQINALRYLSNIFIRLNSFAIQVGLQALLD